MITVKCDKFTYSTREKGQFNPKAAPVGTTPDTRMSLKNICRALYITIEHIWIMDICTESPNLNSIAFLNVSYGRSFSLSSREQE